MPTFWDKIGDFITNLFCTGAASMIDMLYPNGSIVYDNCVTRAISLLSNNSLNFASPLGGAISTITDAFVALGLLFCSLCYLISIASDGLEGMRDTRIESILKKVIMFILATSLTAVSYDIMVTVDKFGADSVMAVTSGIGSGSYTIGIDNGNGVLDYSTDCEAIVSEICVIDATTGKYTAKEGTGIGTALMTMIMMIAYAGIVSACGMIILYAAYTRFFEMLIAIPYSGLAFGSLCGGNSIKRTFDSYIRYVLSVQFSAGTMCMALVLVGTLMSGNNMPGGLFGSSGSWQMILEKIFMCCCGVGMVKSGKQITERILGLH